MIKVYGKLKASYRLRLPSFYSAKQKKKIIFICNDKLVLTYLASNASSIPF